MFSDSYIGHFICNKTIEKPIRRRKDNIKMIIKETECKGLDSSE